MPDKKASFHRHKSTWSDNTKLLIKLRHQHSKASSTLGHKNERKAKYQWKIRTALCYEPQTRKQSWNIVQESYIFGQFYSRKKINLTPPPQYLNFSLTTNLCDLFFFFSAAEIKLQNAFSELTPVLSDIRWKNISIMTSGLVLTTICAITQKVRCLCARCREVKYITLCYF